MVEGILEIEQLKPTLKGIAKKVSKLELWARLYLGGWTIEQACRSLPDLAVYHQGVRFSCLGAVGMEYGICPQVAWGRLMLGWELQAALTTPTKIGQNARLTGQAFRPDENGWITVENNVTKK